MAVIFKSKMTMEDIKDQIIKYVQAIETNYMEAVKDLKECLSKQKQSAKKVAAEQHNFIADRTDLEAHFVQCIEEVRRQVFRRRLKTELVVKKPYSASDMPES